MLCDIPFFDIESVVITGVNFTAVPAGTVVGLVLPKPVQREIKILEILNVDTYPRCMQIQLRS